MLTKDQVKLVQVAVRAAGLRTPAGDERYRLALRQYRRGDGSPVQSCKDLSREQLDDLLALCESLGWRDPNRPEDYHRRRNARRYQSPTSAQYDAISALRHDLGWNVYQLEGMTRRASAMRTRHLSDLTPREAYNMIEAMKAMLGRATGQKITTLQDAKEATDGRTIPPDADQD